MSGVVALCLVSIGCADRRPERSQAIASGAVVHNAIDVGVIRTTFFVVDSVDGTKVHEKMDFQREVSIATGRRELTVRHYTDAVWGSRDSAETCTILVDAEAGREYQLVGAAADDRWRAQLVDRRTGREIACLFADEVAFPEAPPEQPRPQAPSKAPVVAATTATAERAAVAVGDDPPSEVAKDETAAEPSPRPARRKAFCSRGFYLVAHSDGDTTFVLERTDRVRLIGVQGQGDGGGGSEAGVGGIEGKCVRFEYEPTNLIDGHRDRDGRLLAYVFLEDGTFVNVEWIRQGRVRASDERHRYLADFLAAQSAARRENAGLWEAGER